MITTAQSARDVLALTPLTRSALALARRPAMRAALGIAGATPGGSRHSLAPAALRIERSRIRHAAGRADQTALTVWFGTGPARPAPGGGGGAARALLKTGVGVLAAAALGALTVIAARRETKRLEAPAHVPRIEA